MEMNSWIPLPRETRVSKARPGHLPSALWCGCRLHPRGLSRSRIQSSINLKAEKMPHAKLTRSPASAES